MIKIFSTTDKTYNSNGDKVIQPLKARVHNADNGDFYLAIETSLDCVDYLVDNNIIVANTPQGDQAFRISNVTKGKSKLTAKAWHVFYDSKNYLVPSATIADATCADALETVNDATEPESPFTIDSDVTGTESLEIAYKSLYDSIVEILKAYGGHLVRDNYSIEIKASIEHDNGVTVQYGKNLKDITCESKWDDVVTKLLPIGKDGILLNAVDPSASLYVESSTQYDIPFTKSVQFQQAINQQDYPTEAAYKAALVADLTAQATQYVEQHSVPNVNYNLKANLEKITDIGDVVEVIDDRLGIHILTNVIGYEYDCISGQYVSVEFGNFTETLSDLTDVIADLVIKKLSQV